MGIWAGGYAYVHAHAHTHPHAHAHAHVHAHAHAMLYPRCRLVAEVGNGALVSFVVRGGRAAVGTVQTVPRLLGSRRHPRELHEHGSAWWRRGMPAGGSMTIVAANAQLARQLAAAKAKLSAWGKQKRLGSGL